MNARIREITGQVLDELVPETWVALGYDKIKEIQNRTAELIVQECVGIADDYVKDCTCEEHINCKHPRSAIGRKIREHFGVEP